MLVPHRGTNQLVPRWVCQACQGSHDAVDRVGPPKGSNWLGSAPNVERVGDGNRTNGQVEVGKLGVEIFLEALSTLRSLKSSAAVFPPDS